jgi:predicted RNA-binding protein with TRAM domain
MAYDRERRGGFGGGRGFGGPDLTPPVKVGDELEVTIEAVGEKGDGIAKKEGFVLFVPNTKQGQRCRIRVTKVLRKVGFADVVAGGVQAPAEAPAEGEETAEAPAEQQQENAEDTEDFGEEK